MPERFLFQRSFASASSYLEFFAAGTRKAFREMRSQKCMWVNNAGQFGKGHSLSSTEINIIGVWKAAESTLGAWQRQTPRQAPGFTATALSPPVRGSLTTFLHPFCSWPPDWALGPSPSFNWKQTTFMSKQLLNYFLPKQPQNIKHVLNGCPIPWRNFMISLLRHSMFGCLAEVALSPCQTMKQRYY